MSELDVELETLLNSSDTTTDGASAENSEKEVTPSPVTPAEAEPQITERENRRARELAEKVKELEAKLAEREAITNTPSEDFIDKIEDPSTRDLVSRILDEATKRAESKVAPLYTDYQKAQFDKTFSEYSQAIPGLDKYRDILSKEFERNPNMDFKGKIGSIIVDLQLNKRKPIESQGTVSPREPQEVDINKMSKDEMYAYLQTLVKK